MATAQLRAAAVLHLERLGTRIAPAGGRKAAPGYAAHGSRAAPGIRRYLELCELPALRTGVIQIPLPPP